MIRLIIIKIGKVTYSKIETLVKLKTNSRSAGRGKGSK